MIMKVEAIQGAPLAASLETRAEGISPTVSPMTSFGDLMAGAIRESAAVQNAADVKTEALAQGAVDDIHGTMIAAKEAEISLHLVGTIRNKLLDAFHELWRTGL